MSLPIQEIKDQYRELQRRSNEAYQAAEPERQALKEAERPHRELEEQITAFLEEHDKEVIDHCEGCCEPIFEGERCTGGENNLCEACAPTWRDMLLSPENFSTFHGNPCTYAEAKRICDDHVAAGGSLDDKMVS
jgi:hypothetical protein